MKLTIITCASIAILSSGLGAAQDGRRLTFEVASIRPAGSQAGRGGGRVGGPGTRSPERITENRVTLARLLREAYGVDFDQIQGPAWLWEERYDLVANLPPGATTAQVPVMLQHLLEDRFHLQLRHVSKEFPVYELVLAKGGAKLKENVEPNLELVTAALQLPRDQDGYPRIPPGKSAMVSSTENGVTRTAARGQSLEALLFQLRTRLGQTTSSNTFALGRVVDKTGLTGKYDFKLFYSGGSQIGAALALPADPTAGPSFIEALEQQLGLKLKNSMAPFDVLVVDHVDKTPTDN